MVKISTDSKPILERELTLVIEIYQPSPPVDVKQLFAN